MCSNLNPICDVEKVAGVIGGHVAGSVFNQVATSFGKAAAKVTAWMWTVIAQTTTVDLSGGWFRSTVGITATLAGVVITAIFVLELIKAVLKREPGALGRAVVGVGGGLLGAAASIGVVEFLLTATDALSNGVVRTVGLGSLDKLGSRIAPAGAIAGVAEPALILILGLGYLIASFFVWALFIARKAMIIVAAVFAPVAFSGAASRATAGWVRKWVEFTVAMVFSKLVVVIIFTLALSLVGDPGKGMAAVGSLFSGLAMMVLACFAPWMLLKLVHFIGGDVMAAHHQGLTASVAQAGSTPVNLVRSGAAKVGGLVGGGAPSGAAAAAISGGQPSRATVPTPKSLTNNPVIKNVGGTGPEPGGGATGDGPDGGTPPPQPGPPSPTRPSSPSGPTAAPPDGPRPGSPTHRPQPAPLPAST
jgi:type IV secretion system protein TrbL